MIWYPRVLFVSSCFYFNNSLVRIVSIEAFQGSDSRCRWKRIRRMRRAVSTNQTRSEGRSTQQEKPPREDYKWILLFLAGAESSWVLLATVGHHSPSPLSSTCFLTIDSYIVQPPTLSGERALLSFFSKLGSKRFEGMEMGLRRSPLSEGSKLGHDAKAWSERKPS